MIEAARAFGATLSSLYSAGFGCCLDFLRGCLREICLKSSTQRAAFCLLDSREREAIVPPKACFRETLSWHFTARSCQSECVCRLCSFPAALVDSVVYARLSGASFLARSVRY